MIKNIIIKFDPKTKNGYKIIACVIWVSSCNYLTIGGEH